MAVFRIEKTKDYTVMSNYHLRDRSLSLKAKGLLSLMLSLPEDWDYTMKGLARICKDGIDSISGGIRELETHGYLVRARIRNENGQLGSIFSTISIVLMQYSSTADATGRMVLRKKSFKASPLVMGFASFKIFCIFIISDASAKAQGKTQIAAKSLSQGSFQLHILLPRRRLPGRGQELLHVPAHGGVVLLLPPCGELRHLFIYEPFFLLCHIEFHLNVPLSVRHGQPPFLIRVWGLACRLGQRFKAFHALRSPPETHAPASNFDCSGKGPEQRKIRKRVLACGAC